MLRLLASFLLACSPASAASVLAPTPIRGGIGLPPSVVLSAPLSPAGGFGPAAGSMELRTTSVLPTAGPLQTADQAALDRVSAILQRGGGIAPEDRAFLDEAFPELMRLGRVGRTPSAYERSWTERRFPKFAGRDDWRVTGELCSGYNCISWTAGVTDDWLWPDGGDFDAFYAERGYLPMGPGASPEEADIVLWADWGRPTHASRRVAGGWWESKLGAGPRILHRLADLEESVYGRSYRFYKRESA